MEYQFMEVIIMKMDWIKRYWLIINQNIKTKMQKIHHSPFDPDRFTDWIEIQSAYWPFH